MTRDLGLTLAGGGNRAFYQLGVLHRWWERLEPRLDSMATCSAGACVAVILLAGRDREALAFWWRRRAHVTRNFDWSKLLVGERPTPHYQVYRETLLHALAEGGLDRVRSQPFPVLALVAAPPAALPVPLAVPIGLGAYSFERWRHPGKLHPRAGRRLGFEPVAKDLRECDTAEELADWVIASSSTPPFTPVGRIGDRPVLDGGLIDNAPAFLLDGRPALRRQLVLLTRKYPDHVMGERDGRWYLCPSVPPPADRWDYTRPERVTDTIRLGEVDADHRRGALDRWLAGE